MDNQSTDCESLYLMLMRHGEAEGAADGSDKERSLTPSGVQRVRQTSERLQKLDWQPTVGLVSSAIRTQQTFDHLNHSALNWNFEPVVLDSLYLAEQSVLFAECQQRHEDAHCLFALGHNPGWSEAVSFLAGTVDSSLMPGDCACLILDRKLTTGGSLREVSISQTCKTSPLKKSTLTQMTSPESPWNVGLQMQGCWELVGIY